MRNKIIASKTARGYHAYIKRGKTHVTLTNDLDI